MDYGIFIKTIRKMCALSQEELAHELGVSFATINRWERGKTIPSKMAISAIKNFCERRNIALEKLCAKRGEELENQSH